MVTKNIFGTPPNYKNVFEHTYLEDMINYFLKLKNPVGDEIMLKEKAQDAKEWRTFVQQARIDSIRDSSYPESLTRDR